ncbi:hypothetical protein BJX63DRAFT_393205 [Aspergillus granulosus]|uniref:C2H2-type domain-containing protein n=1 Tax=Aspergillus granulosus TaxID=176169 RepID=A0ABR4HEP4_9EURO
MSLVLDRAMPDKPSLPFLAGDDRTIHMLPHDFPEPASPESSSRLTDLDTIPTPSFSEVPSYLTLPSLSSSPSCLTPQSESRLSGISTEHTSNPCSTRRSLLPHTLTQAVPPRLQCTFCDDSFDDSTTLLYHKARAHKYLCELGCNKGFPTKRNRDRHYGSKTHEQSRFMFQCGSCGGQFQGERRDNYLRHLKSCTKGSNFPYICGRDCVQTSDRVAHITHVRACKAPVGRKKKSTQL